MSIVQKFNDLPKEKKDRIIYRWTERFTAIFDGLGYGTECTDCGCFQATAFSDVYCKSCGSENTVSPYYC